MNKINISVSGRSIFYFLSAVLLFFLFRYLRDILTTFGISILIAYLFDPLVNYMEKLRLRRSIGIVLIFFIFSLVVFFFFVFVFPLIYQEIMKIVSEIPRYIAVVTARLEKLSEMFDVNLDMESVKTFLIQRAGSVSKIILSAGVGIGASVYELAKYILNLMLIPILVFYFLKDFYLIKENTFEILRKKVTGFDIDEAYGEFNQIIRTYFRGQLLVSLFLGIAYMTVLLIVGVEGAVSIGLVSGILSIVPYLGFLTGFLSSVFISYVQFNDFLHPFYIVAGFGVVQFIESNFVTPKIVGESLGLHPAAVIFSLMAGGYLMGIGGMIFSLPIAAFIKLVVMKKLSVPD